MKDLRFSVYDVKFPFVRFYKANLADVEGTKKLWAKIIEENGPVHILVNNHAICNGMLIEEMTIEQFKTTMDINFSSYVHLSMLFLAQSEISSSNETTSFHLVNVNSIAGHVTCSRNADYSASKFALTGFSDALRQELELNQSLVKMTNFYPYYINTGLFAGFKPALRWILPTLRAEEVTKRMYTAIMAEEKEVYIDPIIWYLKIFLLVMPLGLRNRALNVLVGQGMEYFAGRKNEANSNARDR